MTGYDFNIGLNTSFTGEDSLDIEIQGGHADAEGISEFDTDTTGTAATFKKLLLLTRFLTPSHLATR